MFFDHVRIAVAAGRGGDGSVSFRREAHVPKGGPDGGDGGRGGDVVIVCDGSIRDLGAFRGRSTFRAGNGAGGEGARRHGAAGAHCELRVPAGTTVSVGGETVAELPTPGDRAVVAAGGAGGHGNKWFATSTRQAPRFSERGLPGAEVELDLRLRLLADAGFVGLPNAGKSSLLARLTRAAPKIAEYPFTTIEPVLGTLDFDDRQLVLIDIPGLIEGASHGAGLGHEFLSHVQRCRMLIHVLDLAPLDGSDPAANFATVEGEIAGYDPALAALPRLLALSKSDLVTTEEADRAAAEWRERLGDRALSVLVTSAATGAGADELAGAIFRFTPDRDEAPARSAAAGPARDEPPSGHRVYRPGERQGFRVEHLEDGRLSVDGRGIEQLVARFDPRNDEAMRYLESRLRAIGVVRALQEAGFTSGGDVLIGAETFRLDV